MESSVYKEAIKHLSKDPVMKGLIKKHGALEWNWEGELFTDLVESIINQQLSEKAGATIAARFKKLFGKKRFPIPEEILKKTDEKIRECGISYPKMKYIKGICNAILSGELVLENLDKLSDEEIIIELTKLKGVGKWTAEMILMFSLKRSDVFSLGDLGLRIAVSKLYKVDRDDIKKIEKISQRWKPFRTIAARYLWKSLG